MSFKSNLRDIVNHVLEHYDLSIVRSSKLHDWQRGVVGPSYHKVALPIGAAEYLQPENPKLNELKRQYAKVDPAVTVPLMWNDKHVKPDEISYFRGDNAYVWQLRNATQMEINYVLTTYYIKSFDSLGLFETLNEDNEFGIHTFSCDGKVVSRDLLDSILEIYFLEKHLKISSWPSFNVLDIGAGYGRLAHRMVQALPNLNSYFCTDAIPVSTFICDYYLHFRNVHEKAKVIPLHEVESTLSSQPIDIAVNIHSFSECTLSATEWWLKLISKYRVKYLMIIPNTILDDILDDGKRIINKSREDFLPIIEEEGYQMIASEPSYDDLSLQKYGISPRYNFLFELRRA